MINSIFSLFRDDPISYLSYKINIEIDIKFYYLQRF